MKLFLHFLRSNFRYNKLELAISYCLTLLFHFAYVYVTGLGVVKGKKGDSSGEIFISVAFYATLYVYYTNKKKTHIKYYLSLPISKAKLLLYKAFSEFIFFIPAIYLVNIGVYYYKAPVHHLSLTLILLQLGTIISLFLFDSAVEEPRLENAKASFMNRLVYVRKAMDFIFRFVAVIYLGTAIYLLQIDMILKEYMIILLMGMVIYFKYNNSLMLIKDESLSYFIPKRDLVRASWKFGIVLAPMLVYGPASSYLSTYGENELVETILGGDRVKLESYYSQHKSWNAKFSNNFTPTLVAIRHGKLELLQYMLENEAPLPLDKSVHGFGVQGMKAIHLAFDSRDPAMLEFIAARFPDSISAQTLGENKTVLHLAVDVCDGKMIDQVLKTSIDLNLQNSEGETALVSAAKNKCYYGMMALVQRGADIKLTDERGQSAFDYLKNNTFRHFLEKSYPAQFDRYIASEAEAISASPEESPAQPSPQTH